MDEIPRRSFLRLGTAGAAALAVGGSSVLLAACDPVGLAGPDPNGLRLQTYFSSRVIATSGQVVAGTGHTWHLNPDGGACFPLSDGGWSYVSNSESIPGGAGFVRFSANGTIVGAGSCLSGTNINCAGGSTPWGTWLSCEEYPAGRVWECDALGAVPGVVRPAMGAFSHEAAAADVARRVIYLTEDRTDSGLYRFVPDTWGDLSSGTLQVLTASGFALSWKTVPDPGGNPVACKDQVPGTVRFKGGEGADMADGSLVFTTKGDGRVWRLEPDSMTLTVVYAQGVTPNGILSGLDNVETRDGVIYVAEDGGDMQIVLVRGDGSTFPVVELPGVAGSEITGPAFNKAGDRLYFSSQRNPGRTYEVSGPWGAFTTPGPLTR